MANMGGKVIFFLKRRNNMLYHRMFLLNFQKRNGIKHVLIRNPIIMILVYLC